MARKLKLVEHHLAAAFGAGGELAASLMRARTAHGLSGTFGQPAVAAVGQLTATIALAMDHSTRGHRLLEPIARRLGIDPSAFGDERKDDDDKPFTGG